MHPLHLLLGEPLRQSQPPVPVPEQLPPHRALIRPVQAEAMVILRVLLLLLSVSAKRTWATPTKRGPTMIGERSVSGRHSASLSLTKHTRATCNVQFDLYNVEKERTY